MVARIAEAHARSAGNKGDAVRWWIQSSNEKAGMRFTSDMTDVQEFVYRVKTVPERFGSKMTH